MNDKEIKMKLSEAISKCKVKKHLIGSYNEYDNDGNVTACCALGAAGLALGIRSDKGDMKELLEAKFPELKKSPKDFFPKEKIGHVSEIFGYIVLLNDELKMSRSAIVKKLKSVGL